MDAYREKLEKKTHEFIESLTTVANIYKSSCIQLNSVSASSGNAASFSANLKQLNREQMHLLVDNYYDSEDSEVATVSPSTARFSNQLGVASTSQAAVPSQVGPTSADLSIAVSHGSHEQHQFASNTSGQSINSLPTVPVSTHLNDVNVELSGHLVRHLQSASGRVEEDIEMVEEGEEEEDEEEENAPASLRIRVLYLNCTENGCKEKLPNREQLTEHLLLKHKIKQYPCLIMNCSQSLATQPEVTDHRRLAHPNLNEFRCGKCYKNLKGYRVLGNHWYELHLSGLFQCAANSCTVTGKNRSQVKLHQRSAKHSKNDYSRANAHV